MFEMKISKKRFLLFIILLLILPTVMAKQGRMVLLAVKETATGYTGSAADLYLEIKPGQGRVFMETFPLSKMDTQISTRFAKEIACNYLDKDCSRYDFFYTIKAKSAIIGGPSAGSALAVLTAAMLDGLEIDETIAITGTINSGGLIGPVSGLRAKIEAADEVNVSHVLIPKGERFAKEDFNLTNKTLNLTTDLKDYGEKYGIEVSEVADLTEALYIFTGKRFKEFDKKLEINKDYLDIMQILARDLCDRTKDLHEQIAESRIDVSLVDEDFIKLEESGINFSERAERAFKDARHYTSASYCYGANVNYRRLLIRIQNFTDFNSVQKDIDEFKKKIIKAEIQTITDLEAYMVVNERLKDAEDSLKKAETNYEEGEDYIRDLARAIERIYSAKSWSFFFEMKNKEFDFSRENLEESCVKKLAEAEERYQYTRTFFPSALKETKKELGYAYDDLESGDYELCLFKASKAKAEVDVILSVIGVDDEQVDNLLANKLYIIKRILAEQQEKGIFPILGYSYYEYANSLNKDDVYSALLYSEYALELSNLDLYFKEKKSRFADIHIDYKLIGIFAAGVVVGAILVLLIKRKKRIRRKKLF